METKDIKSEPIVNIKQEEIDLETDAVAMQDPLCTIFDLKEEEDNHCVIKSEVFEPITPRIEDQAQSIGDPVEKKSSKISTLNTKIMIHRNQIKNGRLGIGLKRKNDAFLVTSLEPGGAAETSGVKTGDLIVEAQRLPTSRLKFSHLQQILIQEGFVWLSIVRQSNSKDATNEQKGLRSPLAESTLTCPWTTDSSESRDSHSSSIPRGSKKRSDPFQQLPNYKKSKQDVEVLEKYPKLSLKVCVNISTEDYVKCAGYTVDKFSDGGVIYVDKELGSKVERGESPPKRRKSNQDPDYRDWNSKEKSKGRARINSPVPQNQTKQKILKSLGKSTKKVYSTKKSSFVPKCSICGQKFKNILECNYHRIRCTGIQQRVEREKKNKDCYQNEDSRESDLQRESLDVSDCAKGRGSGGSRNDWNFQNVRRISDRDKPTKQERAIQTEPMSDCCQKFKTEIKKMKDLRAKDLKAYETIENLRNKLEHKHSEILQLQMKLKAKNAFIDQEFCSRYQNRNRDDKKRSCIDLNNFYNQLTDKFASFKFLIASNFMPVTEDAFLILEKMESYDAGSPKKMLTPNGPLILTVDEKNEQPARDSEAGVEAIENGCVKNTLSTGESSNPVSATESIRDIVDNEQEDNKHEHSEWENTIDCGNGDNSRIQGCESNILSKDLNESLVSKNVDEMDQESSSGTQTETSNQDKNEAKRTDPHSKEYDGNKLEIEVKRRKSNDNPKIVGKDGRDVDSQDSDRQEIECQKTVGGNDNHEQEDQSIIENENQKLGDQKNFESDNQTPVAKSEKPKSQIMIEKHYNVLSSQKTVDKDNQELTSPDTLENKVKDLKSQNALKNDKRVLRSDVAVENILQELQGQNNASKDNQEMEIPNSAANDINQIQVQDILQKDKGTLNGKACQKDFTNTRKNLLKNYDKEVMFNLIHKLFWQLKSLRNASAESLRRVQMQSEKDMKEMKLEALKSSETITSLRNKLLLQEKYLKASAINVYNTSKEIEMMKTIKSQTELMKTMQKKIENLENKSTYHSSGIQIYKQVDRSNPGNARFRILPAYVKKSQVPATPGMEGQIPPGQMDVDIPNHRQTEDFPVAIEPIHAVIQTDKNAERVKELKSFVSDLSKKVRRMRDVLVRIDENCYTSKMADAEVLTGFNIGLNGLPELSRLKVDMLQFKKRRPEITVEQVAGEVQNCFEWKNRVIRFYRSQLLGILGDSSGLNKSPSDVLHVVEREALERYQEDFVHNGSNEVIEIIDKATDTNFADEEVSDDVSVIYEISQHSVCDISEKIAHEVAKEYKYNRLHPGYSVEETGSKESGKLVIDEPFSNAKASPDVYIISDDIPKTSSEASRGIAKQVNEEHQYHSLEQSRSSSDKKKKEEYVNITESQSKTLTSELSILPDIYDSNVSESKEDISSDMVMVYPDIVECEEPKSMNVPKSCDDNKGSKSNKIETVTKYTGSFNRDITGDIEKELSAVVASGVAEAEEQQKKAKRRQLVSVRKAQDKSKAVQITKSLSGENTGREICGRKMKDDASKSTETENIIISDVYWSNPLLSQEPQK